VSPPSLDRQAAERESADLSSPREAPRDAEVPTSRPPRGTGVPHRPRWSKESPPGSDTASLPTKETRTWTGWSLDTDIGASDAGGVASSPPPERAAVGLLPSPAPLPPAPLPPTRPPLESPGPAPARSAPEVGVGAWTSVLRHVRREVLLIAVVGVSVATAGTVLLRQATTRAASHPGFRPAVVRLSPGRERSADRVLSAGISPRPLSAVLPAALLEARRAEAGLWHAPAGPAPKPSRQVSARTSPSGGSATTPVRRSAAAATASAAEAAVASRPVSSAPPATSPPATSPPTTSPPTTSPPTTSPPTTSAPASPSPAQLGQEALALVRYPWSEIPGYSIHFLPISDAPAPDVYGNTTFTWGQPGGVSDLYVFPGESVDELAGITAFEIAHEVDAAYVEPAGGHQAIENAIGVHPASWAPNCDCAEYDFMSGWYANVFSNYWSPGVGDWARIAPLPSPTQLAEIARWLDPPR